MTTLRLIIVALLASLLWPPAAALGWYARLTAPYTIEGTTWPAGTYVPVARDGNDSWLMRATTTSPRIPKSVSELVPRVMNADRHSVGVEMNCTSYEFESKKSHPSSTMFDPATVEYRIQPYIGAQLMSKEGDAYIIKMLNPKGGPDELSRVPLHCITFHNGGQFKAAYVSEPFAATDLVDDRPFLSNPLLYGLAGGILVLIAVRLVLYDRN